MSASNGGGQGPYDPNYPNPQQPQGGYQQPQAGYQQPQAGYPQQGYGQPQAGYPQPGQMPQPSVSPNGMTHQGVFRPPVISFAGLTFRIAGPGQVAIGPQGLGLTGFKHQWPKYVLPLIIAAAVGLIVLVAILLPGFMEEGARTASQSRYMLVLLVGPPAVALVPLLRRTGSYDGQQPVQYLIPWANITKVVPGRTVTQITVKGHSPSGVIFFEPTAGGTNFGTIVNRQRQAAR